MGAGGAAKGRFGGAKAQVQVHKLLPQAWGARGGARVWGEAVSLPRRVPPPTPGGSFDRSHSNILESTERAGPGDRQKEWAAPPSWGPRARRRPAPRSPSGRPGEMGAVSAGLRGSCSDT